SGDIGWDWDAFRRRITAGLNFSLTGMPYWTTDIGGFFRPGSYQYKSPEYHDILTRWFQFGAFNPVFRIHGYQSETEPWKYGETVENNMRKMLNLRYRLIPYIYSEAWKTSNKGSTMMRPLVMDFMDDNAAIDQAYQYMFGSALLVAPVTLPNAKQWDVYLPKASNWTDFWTNQSYPGGKIVNVDAPQDRIPLFVKAGSVLVLGKEMQHTGESLADTLEVRIYPGANGSFELYEDEGDNYNYEEKQYTLIPFKWDDRKKTLLIGAIQGSFKGQLKNRVFNIIMVQPEQVEKQRLKVVKSALTYNGTSKKLKLN
ncbi:MAG: glycoside hydrolase family 31 protein, partial [Pedobacter sp.]